MNPSRILQISQVAKIRNLQISQATKICSLRIFAGCEISQHCSCACCTCCLLFDPHFCGFIQVFPSCNFGSLAHFCNFLILSTYISSVLLVIKSTISPSINQGKLWHEASFPLMVCDFLFLSFIFLHFLGSQTPLDDDKLRDARLKPPHP